MGMASGMAWIAVIFTGTLRGRGVRWPRSGRSDASGKVTTRRPFEIHPIPSSLKWSSFPGWPILLEGRWAGQQMMARMQGEQRRSDQGAGGTDTCSNVRGGGPDDQEHLAADPEGWHDARSV